MQTYRIIFVIAYCIMGSSTGTLLDHPAGWIIWGSTSPSLLNPGSLWHGPLAPPRRLDLPCAESRQLRAWGLHKPDYHAHALRSGDR
jgi:hypothetical protein